MQQEGAGGGAKVHHRGTAWQQVLLIQIDGDPILQSKPGPDPQLFVLPCLIAVLCVMTAVKITWVGSGSAAGLRILDPKLDYWDPTSSADNTTYGRRAPLAIILNSRVMVVEL